MNKTDVTLSKAIDEFFVAKRARRLSPNTLSDYTITLGRFKAFIGPDTSVIEIEPLHIRHFLAGLTVSGKTVLNAYIALSSLWTWLVREGLCSEHIVRRVEPPKAEQRIILPLSRAEIDSLLACAATPDRRRNYISNSARSRAIILFLLDTGVRASELCSLTLGDIQGDYVTVMGKGAKERGIPLSPRTSRALMDYLDLRPDALRQSPLFSVVGGHPMTRFNLLKWLHRLGERAGVPNVHPHRFRHTFAVNYLRNGGDALSLKRLLGHSCLDMVQRYVLLATEDLAAIHRRASPVENWQL